MQRTLVLVVALTPWVVTGATAQLGPGLQGSDNMTVLSHVPLGGDGVVNDIEIEQDLARPFVYVSRRAFMGFDIIDIKDVEQAKHLYRWQIENPELHEGRSLDNKYVKLEDRYYTIQSFAFRGGSPNRDVGAIVFDVTGLPDTSTIREVARIRAPDNPGGFHNIFAYKHSDGRSYVFATTASRMSDEHGANIYDLERLLNGAPNSGLVGRVPMAQPRGGPGGYHDAYVAYHQESGQDRFYGGGPETSYEGGQYIYDVSDVSSPKLLAMIMAVRSQQSGGHTFVVTPDGRYGLTEMTSPGHQPIRFFDLQPALDGNQTIVPPIAEWTADWRKSSHNMEIRWPYVFVSAYQDGVQVLDMRNPTKPHTVGFYDTFTGVQDYEGGGVAKGVFGIDVRNADGLIVASDMQSGFWALKMEGFDGWNGHDWGQPNVSSVQDWDNGPDGAPRPERVS